MYHSVIDDPIKRGVHPALGVSNFTEALANGARSAACQLLGLPQYLNDMTTRLSGGTFTPFLGGIPNLWRRALCDTDAPPSNPPPWTGGQCAFFYNVTYRRAFTQNSTGVEVDQNVNFPSPVVGPVSRRFRQVGDNRIMDIVNGLGNVVGSPSINSTTNTIEFFDIISTTPTNGQPDTCGNPPPEYPPLTPPDVTIPRDIPYTNSDGVDVTIPVVFVFARAQIDVDANVIIPFTLNLSPMLNITGNLNVDGTVNFNFGGGTATTRPKDPRKGDCGDISEPSDPVPTDPTDSEQPPQPDREREEVIKGVLVTVTSLSNERASLIVQSDNPDIYAPSLGHVQFLCRIGDTSAAWTSDQPVKNRRNLIPCPWADGAIAVRGTPQPGVTWTLTPIRGYAGVPVDYVTQ